ncbi:hypothetical protein SELMODRAFT_404893 [Selaginella moellendorffii]|uniref:RCC1-like domain-containing protein n=1 Tax=Selaginella moellendorffii TaxID=88036 RepID=D8QXQ0_SELML|nr:ultraviolet-B receptor UVR8 [Selaginella moellendorffii]EFJ35462.1 hypothetical protein SELMODRAFT_404893 [Selaginella moellendorffii]|eukprot:XP_002963591.1 ultraviolet-B receptor UVR8 [Selaginella moellendorffii]
MIGLARRRNVLGRAFHTAAVYSFGDGSNGALGHPHSFTNDSFEPAAVPGLPPSIARVACGHYHSLALSRSGELWAWGRNNEGQLGRGEKSILSAATITPQRVRGMESTRVRAAAGSGVVSMAICEDGSLWSWGSSKRGQLGLGLGVTSSLLPQKIHALAGKSVLQVSLGWGHALACTMDGELFSWGYHDSGRLGYLLPQDQTLMIQPSKDSLDHNDVGEKMLMEQLRKEDAPILQWEPKLVKLPEPSKIVQVACGLDHSLALSESGLLFSFGDNSTAQLGRETTEDSPIISRVGGDLEGKQVVAIGAGWGHSLAVERCSRAAYTWGWSSGSQLGRSGPSSVPKQLEELDDPVVSVAGGRVHSLALTSKHQVWTWGCGRNGRLGLGSSRDENLPVLVESLEEHAEVIDVCCGYDHSLLLAR